MRSKLLLLATLALLAIAGGGAICLQVGETFEATAQVSLPMESGMSADASSLPSSAIVQAAALHQLAAERARLSSASLTLRPGYTQDSVLIGASADSLANAVGLANAAAQITVARDRALWLKAIARHNSPTNLRMRPLAGIIQYADDRGAGTASQYSLAWNPRRADLAAAWVALMALIAAIVIATPSNTKSRIVFRPGSDDILDRDASAGAPSDRPEHLPILAGILMLRDSSDPDRISVRPVLTDVDPNLWGWLAGHVQPAQSDVGRATATASPVAREFLITRCMDGDAGSRSAAIALGRALSKRGLAAVVLDADLCSTPSQLDEMGLPDEMPGLVDILDGSKSIDDCVLEDDDYPGLAAICAGRGAAIDWATADHLLGSVQFVDVLDRLAETYSVVLIHGPSAPQAAQYIPHRVDATLLAVPEEMSDIGSDALRWAVAYLRDARANVIGRVDICTEDRLTNAGV